VPFFEDFYYVRCREAVDGVEEHAYLAVSIEYSVQFPVFDDYE
jgi:hypothetical protein